jgi:hypothetical protein
MTGEIKACPSTAGKLIPSQSSFHSVKPAGFVLINGSLQPVGARAKDWDVT